MNQQKIQDGVRLILEGIGEDLNREGLRETPERIARMYEEICGGMTEDAGTHLQKTFSVSDSGIVMEKDIVFYSMCEHHMLPFYGKAHIAYIPDGKVVGLSKLARTVEVFAETKPPASPILVPTNTSSPFLTRAFAGAPMCWLIRMRTCAGRGIGTGLLAAVALSCGVCAPSAARFSLFNME